MKRLLVALTLFCSTSLVADELLVRPVHGEPFLLEVEGEESVAELKQRIQQQQGYPAGQQRLMYGGALLDPEDAVEEGMVTLELTQRYGDSGVADTFRQYERGVTKAERDGITYIVTTMGNCSLASIATKQGKLKEKGDVIDGVHPFRFFEVIFGQDETIVGIRNLRGRGWLYDKFTSGLFESLGGERDRDNLLPHFNSFAANLKIDGDLIYTSVVDRDWSALLNTLIDTIERKGNPDDIDF